MAEKRRPQNQAYIHGNTVRKTEPGRHLPERPGKKNSGQTSRRVRRNQEKALQIASCCTLFICINYIQVRSVMTNRVENIRKLEQELEALKVENDTEQTRINTSVDLDYVYKVATEELGMVYAGKDQIRMYHQTESEYVRQYEDIPNY